MKQACLWACFLGNLKSQAALGESIGEWFSDRSSILLISTRTQKNGGLSGYSEVIHDKSPFFSRRRIKLSVGRLFFIVTLAYNYLQFINVRFPV